MPGSSWTFAHGLCFGHVHDRLVIAVDHTTTTAEGGMGEWTGVSVGTLMLVHSPKR